MTYTKKKVLPALHESEKVTNPDLPNVGDSNYTATILKYANLALKFPQLDTDAKTIVAAINELYNQDDTAHRTLTKAEYDALPEEEKMDGTIYFISDVDDI